MTGELPDKYLEHMEVYHFEGRWKPIPVRSTELPYIWSCWHDRKLIEEDKKNGSVTIVGMRASGHIEELFNHIAYLELELEKSYRERSRS